MCMWFSLMCVCDEIHQFVSALTYSETSLTHTHYYTQAISKARRVIQYMQLAHPVVLSNTLLQRYKIRNFSPCSALE